MILTIDIGNSNINVGGYENDLRRFAFRLLTATNRTETEYAVLLHEAMLLHKARPEEMTGAIIASVVPSLSPVLQRAVKLLCGLDPLQIGPGIKTGLNIRIDNPGQLGADFVATAVGAIERYPLPAVVIDLGTATKFSVIDKNKTFIGGSIMAGVQISLDALSTRTAQLPRIGLDDSPELIGTNTVDCMRSGVILGAASMIDGMLERYREKLGTELTAIACGGLAAAITRHCKRELILDHSLLLDGLYRIYQKNAA